MGLLLTRTLAGFGVVALVAATPAQASSGEVGYLGDLNGYGFRIHNVSDALDMGYWVCDALNNATGDVVAEELFNRTSWSTTRTYMDAGQIVMAAVNNLCPWHDHRGQRIT